MLARPIFRVLGVGGGIAAGKTKRCEALAALDGTTAAVPGVPAEVPLRVTYLNADRLGHQCYTPGSDCYAAVVGTFGSGILAEATEGSDGAGDAAPAIDRRKLGAVVFADEAKLAQLSSIVWPDLSRRVAAGIAEAKVEAAAAAEKAHVVVLEAALLLDIPSMATQCDAVWLVHVDRATAIERVMARDGVTASQAEDRLNRQDSNEQRLVKAEALGLCGVRVVDTTTCDSVEEQVPMLQEAFVADLLAERPSTTA